MASLIAEFSKLQIPLEDIEKATKSFSNKRIIGRGDFGNVYWGKLKWSGELIKITARRLDRRYGQGDVEFWTEVSMLSSIKHKNIVSMIGYCDEKGEKIIVCPRYAKGSLSMHITNPILTWKQRFDICHGIASAIEYIHQKVGQSYYVIHRNINSSTILLDKNWEPKLSGFEFSIKHSVDRRNHVVTGKVIGTNGYIDPDIYESGGVTHKSDIYSLGVVILEIMCGRTAKDDSTFPAILSTIDTEQPESDDGFSFFEEQIKILKDMIHPELLNQLGTWKSLHMFSYFILFDCVSNTRTRITTGQSDRPDAGDVVTACLILSEGEEKKDQSNSKAEGHVDFPLDGKDETDEDGEIESGLCNPGKENHKDLFRMSFEDINLATENFSKDNRIGGGGFGGVYRGTLVDEHGKGHRTIAAKRLDKSQGQGEKQFYNELQILYEYKHDNIIGLLGYSNETDEKIIVYEHAPKGSLDRYLGNVGLTWRNRLKICINMATGLAFIHGGIQGQNVVIHRDLKSANILLFEDWKAKVGDFGLSLISAIDKETNFTFDHPCGTMDYLDPMYLKSKILTVESDVYSFGVVLFEILYGKETYKISKPKSESLLDYIKHNFEEGKQEEIVFEYLKKEIMPKSLATFMKIVQECLAYDREKRPTSKEVLLQLTKALELQDEDVQDIGTDSGSHFRC